MAGGDPHPHRPPQEDVEKFPTPVFAPPIAKASPPTTQPHPQSTDGGALLFQEGNGGSSTFIGALKINLQPKMASLPTKASYASLLKASPTPLVHPRSFEEPYHSAAPTLKPIATHEGKPAIAFSVTEKIKLIGNLKYVLIAKSSHGRPSLAIIRKFFLNLQLKGVLNLSVFDSKHLYVECTHFEDFVKIWCKGVWIISGFPLRMFKWDEEFYPTRESAIVPVWIHLPHLPLFLFEKKALLSIANAIGRPLKIDINNINRSKLGCASFCVEIDVSKALVDNIWISVRDDCSDQVVMGFWQHVVYGSIPHFCTGCAHLGHIASSCLRRVEVTKKQTVMGTELNSSSISTVLVPTVLSRLCQSLKSEGLNSELQFGQQHDVITCKGKEKATGDKGRHQIEGMLAFKTISDSLLSDGLVCASKEGGENRAFHKLERSNDTEELQQTFMTGLICSTPAGKQHELSKILKTDAQKSDCDESSSLVKVGADIVHDGPHETISADLDLGSQEGSSLQPTVELQTGRFLQEHLEMGKSVASVDQNKGTSLLEVGVEFVKEGKNAEFAANGKQGILAAVEDNEHQSVDLLEHACIDATYGVTDLDCLDDFHLKPFEQGAEIKPTAHDIHEVSVEQGAELKPTAQEIHEVSADLICKQAGRQEQAVRQVEGSFAAENVHISAVSVTGQMHTQPMGTTEGVQKCLAGQIAGTLGVALKQVDGMLVRPFVEAATVQHVTSLATPLVTVGAANGARTGQEEKLENDATYTRPQMLGRQALFEAGTGAETLTPRKLSSAAAEFTPKWAVLVEELVEDKKKSDPVLVEEEKSATAGGQVVMITNNDMEQLKERLNRLRGNSFPAAQSITASTWAPPDMSKHLAREFKKARKYYRSNQNWQDIEDYSDEESDEGVVEEKAGSQMMNGKAFLTDEMGDIPRPFKIKSAPNSPKGRNSSYDSSTYLLSRGLF